MKNAHKVMAVKNKMEWIGHQDKLFLLNLWEQVHHAQSFPYLPSAEKESGFRIAITGFCQGKDDKTRLSERIGGKEWQSL